MDSLFVFNQAATYFNYCLSNGQDTTEAWGNVVEACRYIVAVQTMPPSKSLSPPMSQSLNQSLNQSLSQSLDLI